MGAWSFCGKALPAALGFFAAFGAPAAARAGSCISESVAGVGYTICTVDPPAADLQLFWKSEEGEPYRTFSAVAEAVRTRGRTLVFALNAGMYKADFSPVGLYMENGRTLRPANTASIDGSPAQVPNFYKKPNGIFFVGQTGAGILPTEAFLRAPPDVRLATQSGPMLVIGDTLHPAFIPGSSDRTRRSGVGICQEGKVRFAISEGGVNFDEFARLFRDHLACPDALFLDGGRGAGLYAPDMKRNDLSWHGGYGPVLGLVE